MFRKKTTFVIGAGAGVDIGMPTGAELIDEISKRVNIAFERGQRRTGSATVEQALRMAAGEEGIEPNRLFSAGRMISTGARQMRSIDNYIHTHSHDEAIKICGKIGIVEAILDYEKRCALFMDTKKHPPKFRDGKKAADSWLDQFMHLVVSEVVIQKDLEDIFSNLAIINFNYDRCLEQFMLKSLMDTFAISEGKAAGLISKLLLHHPYGKIAPLPWQTDRGRGLPLGGDPDFFDYHIQPHAKNIKTYNEEVQESQRLREVRRFLLDSRNVVFLGFHFHSQNVKLIQSPESDSRLNIYHTFISTYGRRPPEKEVIAQQVKELLHGKAETYTHMDILECKEVLVSYGTMLTS